MRKIPVFLFVWLLAVFSSLPISADNLIMKDGSEHEGKFISGTLRVITFRENGQIHRYDLESVDAVQFGPPLRSDQGNSYGNNNASGQVGYSSRSGGNQSGQHDRSDASPQTRNHDSLDAQVIPAGTELAIRTNEDINSDKSSTGQTFAAQVDHDVLGSSNRILIPRGSEAQLVIKKVGGGGVTGSPQMTLDVRSVTIRGRSYLIDTSDIEEKGKSGIGANRRTGEMVGGGAVLGTIIGAIAGGGKGAAIGALGGAAAGGGVEVLTKGDKVHVPAETLLNFRVDQAIQLRGR